MKRAHRTRRTRLLPGHVSWSVGPLVGIGVLAAWTLLRYVAMRQPSMHGVVVELLFGKTSLQLACLSAAFSCLLGLLGAWRADARGRLLDAQRSLNSLKALSWREFERLVAEAYRRLGYVVDVVGQGGADGGVDLVLRRPAEKVLVQCKQWRSNSVGAGVVREMAGLMLHHRASSVKVVCVGKFTRDACAFVAGKPIELVGGETLLALVRSVQKGTVATLAAEDGAPACPECGHSMCRRYSKARGAAFWGCTAYPRCKGIRVFQRTHGTSVEPDGW